MLTTDFAPGVARALGKIIGNSPARTGALPPPPPAGAAYRGEGGGGGGNGDGRSYEQLKVWGVFLLCLLISALGVLISFVAFGSTITGRKIWAIGIVIAVVMLGISYGAKYANADARKSFTPVDAIQYLSQGFLWPSTWPALADFLGVQKINAPEKTTYLLDVMEKVVTQLASYV